MSVKYIDPLYDAGFKLIFGREKISEPLLKDLLNKLFENDSELNDITSVTYVNNEQPHEYIHGRSLRYDISCVTSSGHRFIVEMQKADMRHFMERAFYYVARSIASQGHKGKDDNNKEWDFSLVPVIGVFFCNFSVRELPEKVVCHIRPCEMESHKPVGDYTRYVFIQLPNFLKTKDDCDSGCDQWIYNIKNMGMEQNVAFSDKNEVFKYLDSISSVAALSPNEREEYESRLRWARDYNAGMSTARELGFERGLEEGILKGREEGILKGREEGILKGREEGILKGREEGILKGREEGISTGERNIVVKMHGNGMDIEEISKITGISKTTIQEYIKQ